MPACCPISADFVPAGDSAGWAPAFRRRARWPGPISSTGPDRARTGFSTSFIDIRSSNARRSFPPRKRSPGEGYWEVGDHRLQLDFWPFNHKPPSTVLRRQGVPFWDYLDAGGDPVHVLRLAVQLPAQPFASRQSPVHLRHGHTRHAGNLRHLPALCRGWPLGHVGRGWREAFHALSFNRRRQGHASSGRRTAS